MSEKDELIFKIISISVIILILIICIGVIIRSARNVMYPTAEQDIKPKEMKMVQAIELTHEQKLKISQLKIELEKRKRLT